VLLVVIESSNKHPFISNVDVDERGNEAAAAAAGAITPHLYILTLFLPSPFPHLSSFFFQNYSQQGLRQNNSQKIR
jgi:hypothetical protein